jgi:hypothetical protein
VSGPRWILGFVGRPAGFHPGRRSQRHGLDSGQHRQRASAGEKRAKTSEDVSSCASRRSGMRPFPSAKAGTVQESRTSLIGSSGARNTGKRPGQRRDGRPDAHHDSRELGGYLLFGQYLDRPPAGSITGTGSTSGRSGSQRMFIATRRCASLPCRQAPGGAGPAAPRW